MLLLNTRYWRLESEYAAALGWGTEYRHQHGLRCLGIPNVPKVFNEVTRIDDALKLWKEMQQRERTTFDHDKDEEFEDSDGNVYNKKTYLDLQRQGLL